MAKIFNQSDRNPVGMIVSSMLTLAQFQAINGTSWVLADGSSVTGSLYATTTGVSTIPDLRGVVLRGKNNGLASGQWNPDGDSALGTFQDSNYASHQHGVNTYGGLNIDAGYIKGNTNSSAAPTASTNYSGGNETRMKNVTVNHFIKINN
jgi:hypothetical protein